MLEKWLKAWDSEMAHQGWKVCLLIDNCTAHHINVQLNNIEIEFLLLNTM